MAGTAVAAPVLNRYRVKGWIDPPRTRPPATLASLAAELGISRTTVSNAYNRPDQLSPQLRSRVMEAARRMGYPGPDPVARSLRTRKAGAVGLLLTEQVSYAFRDPGAVAFLEGLTLECDEARVGLLLVPARPDSEDVLGGGRRGGRRVRRLLDARRRSAPGRRAGPAGAVGDLRPARASPAPTWSASTIRRRSAASPTT